jgi:lipopolysaccharide export system protein LptC
LGMTAETEQARFDGTEMIARGELPVTVRGPAYRIQANGFIFDFPAESFTFEGDVQSVVGAAP